ncbi:PIN domain-containing protein [Halalkalicoccus ordinarius]|uniref:PIN domain-containing protein n=1 Tax=Halalkalicoccus ordinarius TaxID=3116651 RepID=UPI00300EBB9E
MRTCVRTSVYCPDTNFLIDYLDEDRPASEGAKALLEANPNREYRIPSVALFEVSRGGARLRGAAGVADLIEQLSWADPLPLTLLSAREAALIDGELEKFGQKINLGDVLIAGTVREASGTIVTRDSHFEHVEGLDVRRY